MLQHEGENGGVVVVLGDGRETVDFGQGRGKRYDNELGDVGSGRGGDAGNTRRRISRRGQLRRREKAEER
jgi:hypothetical protein